MDMQEFMIENLKTGMKQSLINQVKKQLDNDPENKAIHLENYNNITNSMKDDLVEKFMSLNIPKSSAEEAINEIIAEVRFLMFTMKDSDDYRKSNKSNGQFFIEQFLIFDLNYTEEQEILAKLIKDPNLLSDKIVHNILSDGRKQISYEYIINLSNTSNQISEYEASFFSSQKIIFDYSGKVFSQTLNHVDEEETGYINSQWVDDLMKLFRRIPGIKIIFESDSMSEYEFILDSNSFNIFFLTTSVIIKRNLVS